MPPLMPSAVREDRGLTELRGEVRAFIADEIAHDRWSPGIDTWLTGWDPSFSRRLAERGWLGMTIPVEHGGHGRTFEERFVVTEELLAAGAPVAAHWIGDRQVAPTLLRFAGEELKRAYLPRIADGSAFFGIGMSEPDAGSDLAAVQTRATWSDDAWHVTGSKVWTSGAHLADAFIVLARTAPVDPSDRHAGLTQFVVEFDLPGVSVNPIVSATGHHHFNEVVMEDVRIEGSSVVGEVGNGWRQVTSELAFERSGPERFLSTHQLLENALLDLGAHDAAAAGRYVARTAALHQMSLSIAASLRREERADTAAAVVKVLGTTHEGDIAEWVDLQSDASSAPVADLARRAVEQRPGFTLRGGTNEILRGVIARGLGLR